MSELDRMWYEHLRTSEAKAERLAPKVTQYTIDAFPESSDNHGIWRVTVEYKGDDLWGVYHHCWCLNRRTMAWDPEPLTSRRTAAWKRTHRFGLPEALTLARKAVEALTVNGKKWTDVRPEPSDLPG